MLARLDAILEQASFLLQHKSIGSICTHFTRPVPEHEYLTGDKKDVAYFYKTYEEDDSSGLQKGLLRIQWDGRTAQDVMDRQSVVIEFCGKAVYEAFYDGVWKVKTKNPSKNWRQHLDTLHSIAYQAAEARFELSILDLGAPGKRHND